jgi:hypothetical protein
MRPSTTQAAGCFCEAAQILSGTRAFFGSAPNSLFPAALSATRLPRIFFSGIINLWKK